MWKSGLGRASLAGVLALSALASSSGCAGEVDESGGGGADGSKSACGSTASECDGLCATTLTDADHCGGCGLSCDADEFCEESSCQLFCVTGESFCDGSCLTSVHDPDNCGRCNQVCDADQYCDAGDCSTGCSGIVCPAFDGGRGECVHLESDPDHCGQCGNACPAGQRCEEGQCTVDCPDGRARCGESCADLLGDAAHCGACGNTCEEGQPCVDGRCGGTCDGDDCACASGRADCGGVCVDIRTNVFHCGACDGACATGQSCLNGECGCPDDGEICGDACVDFDSDADNCGACGEACAGGSFCVDGSCECPESQDVCDGLCVDKSLSRAHCGVCGNGCLGAEQCVDGACRNESTGGDECGGSARNIDITKVALYQAVEVELFDGASVLSGEARNTDVVADKDAIVRVFVEPGADFAKRELSARVHVQNGESGTTYHHKRTVSEASSQRSLASTFRIPLPRAQLSADTQIVVELVECGVPPDGVEGSTRVPETGELDLDVRETGAVEVVFVPIRHDGRVPDISEAVLDKYVSLVERAYPTVGLLTSVADAIDSGETGIEFDLSDVLDRVRSKRLSDAPAAQVYYYGLIQPSATFASFCSAGCTTGVAFMIGPSSSNQHERAGVGVAYGDQLSAETFLHELGHNHGRDHSPCGLSDYDASFPYSGASLGVWGYDIDSAVLKDPNVYKDFMSYCDPYWVSDWTFSALADHISSVNAAFELRTQGRPLSPWIGGPLADPAGPAVYWDAMLVNSRGASWRQGIVTRIGLGPSPELGVVYGAGGEVLATVDVHRRQISHGGGYLLYVPPQQSGWYAVGLADGPALPY